jgi:hypothetical protein
MGSASPLVIHAQLVHILMGKPVFLILPAQVEEPGTPSILNAFAHKILSGMVKPATLAEMGNYTLGDLDAPAPPGLTIMAVNVS